MKKLAPIAIALLMFFSCSDASKSVKEKTAHVYGNCELCKARIEAAAKIKGVNEASWNVDSKLLTFKLDTTITSVESILRAVAAVGHDNEAFMGNDYAYQKLPERCHYERKEE